MRDDKHMIGRCDVTGWELGAGGGGRLRRTQAEAKQVEVIFGKQVEKRFLF